MLKNLYIYFLLLCTSLALGTPTRYELPAHASLLNTAERYIAGEIGNTEKKGDNSDEFIKKYLKSVGIYSPAPYCASGIYWAFGSASVKTGYKNPLKKTGVATTQFNHFKNTGRRTEYKAHHYDLIVWQKPKSWSGHIEFIVSVGSKGWVETVGFNTSSTDPREGDGVYLKRRHLFNPLGMMFVKGLCGFCTEEK